ncbi:membrane-spanning 4-domains subfamily A member 8-like [Hyla sarda]|uniref:membrane-spanning 4-domains subfamily A member 8-like n=1 Tax=Hyla sarda TaxID=327740 RepID=UPI0024C4489B|nr:membrane-spanning 4-domains subfamily A member 8-like [Hyla sarda]
MSSPSNEAGTHNYEPVPCTMIPPEENVTAQNSALPGNIQPIPCGPNVYSVPPGVTPAVPQNKLSPAMHQTFVQQKTQHLAIVLIVTSIVQFFLGVGALFTSSYYIFFSGIPLWGIVCYLVAGTLTIAIRRSPAICLLRGSLGLNILGSIISCIGAMMACLDIVSAASIICYRDVCLKPANTVDIVVFSFILIAYLLLFSVATSIAVFGCNTLSYVPTAPQVFLVQNGVAVPAPTSAYPATTVVFTQSPPSCIVPVEEN